MTYAPPAAGAPLDAATLEGMVGQWQDYVVAWTSSGTAPAPGNGTLTGRYCVIGDTVHFSIKLTGGTTTTWGTGNYNFSLPVTAAATADHVGTVFVGDSSVGSAGYSTGVAFTGGSATTVQGYTGNEGAAAAISNANPQTLATGDRIWIHGTYEAA
ncbi:hypothetical protein GLX30_30485 [Streptomyces sp. Tu 2975]|uniref:hypothetical protein n=1 Tax=Streptomyces sp. Tu 2975 TaxID=2676871 RepID=UPI00135684A4|nr:hypothetical protein [Streptomyces sp. Tu 2975]QIP87642.1 hypothetical protein GLX30_30485 [Streptomyces sp. Tu 2975]